MPEQRRRFSPQFKAEAVQMVIETGKPIAEVARDLGIHDGTLGNWVKAWRRCQSRARIEPLSPVERARVKETGRRDPPAADGERVPEKSRGLLRQDARRSRALRADRGGEGQLHDHLDVPAAGRAALVVLCLAQPGRDRRPQARRRELAAQVRRVFDDSRQTSGCRRVAAAAQPGRARVLASGWSPI